MRNADMVAMVVSPESRYGSARHTNRIFPQGPPPKVPVVTVDPLYTVKLLTALLVSPIPLNLDLTHRDIGLDSVNKQYHIIQICL